MIHNYNNKYVITDTTTSGLFVVLYKGQWVPLPNDRYLSSIYSNCINKVVHNITWSETRVIVTANRHVTSCSDGSYSQLRISQYFVISGIRNKPDHKISYEYPQLDGLLEIHQPALAPYNLVLRLVTNSMI